MTTRLLGMWDYVVVVATLLISVAIGLYFRLSGNRQKSTQEYLMAGNNMSKFPVVFSLVVTRLSSVVLLGEPSEIYLHGTQRMAALIFSSLGIMTSAFLFLPVFFKIGGCSVHEYLEKRFGKFTRKSVSVFWTMQMILYMSVVLYTPSLSLSSITKISTEVSIVVLGLVCTLYSSLGGLKAVIWTDLFQAMLMFACLFAVLVQGVLEVGSFQKVFDISDKGKRLQLFNMSPDLTIRYTFWNSAFYGLINNAAFYGVNQAQVQRLLSIKNLKGAQTSLIWSIIPFNIMHILSAFVGITLYAVFEKCDPLSKGSGTGLFKSDQIVPYFITTRIGAYPAVAGLCVAGIFSGSLSSLSSAISSLTTVTMVDYIEPTGMRKVGIKDSSSAVLAKVIGVFYGLAITGLAFLVSRLDSVLQTAVVFNGIVLGPLLGLFCLGMLTTRANQKGVLIGAVNGVLLSGFIGFLGTFKKYKYPTLIRSTEGCPNLLNATVSSIIVNTSSRAINSLQQEFTECTSSCNGSFMLHKISYMWVPTIGFFVTLVVGYLASFLCELCIKKGNKVNLQLISPVARTLLGYKAQEEPVQTQELETLC